jgi:hypothetical protein
MRLRYKRREEVRAVNYWYWYRGRRGCTYAQSRVRVERVGEMGESREGKVRRLTDVPLHHPPFKGAAS